jgi:hypothetical protein
MFSDLTTRTEMDGARLLMGATMVGLLGARFFRGRAQMVQIVVAGLYAAVVLGFIFYYTL